MVAGGRFELLAKRPPEIRSNSSCTLEGCQKLQVLADVSPGIFPVRMSSPLALSGRHEAPAKSILQIVRKLR